MTVLAEELPIAVTVPKAETGKGFLGLPHADIGRGIFVIEVVAFGLTSQVRRPYEEFERLHADISQFVRSLPSEVRLRLNYALPSLPSATWVWGDASKTLDERRRKLEDFLQKLLLQPEVVHDEDRRLLRFLSLSTAAIDGTSLVAMRTCGPWLERLWETTAEGDGLVLLQHPLVEAALVHAISDAVQGGASALCSDAELCQSLLRGIQMLERTFAAGAGGAAMRPEPLLRRHVEVLVVALRESATQLPLRMDDVAIVDGERELAPASPLVQKAAGDALLTLARVDADCWQRSLHAYLGNPQALQDLASLVQDSSQVQSAGSEIDAASKGPVSAERILAELLLRGLHGEAIVRFVEPEVTSERKQLLNVLFASNDVFVRLVVGLLLCRLLCEPGYLEAAKAEAGLSSLCRELAPQAPRLVQAGLGHLLLEDDLWMALSNILASQDSSVSGFALFVVVHVARPSPSLVLRTPHVHEALVSMLEPAADPSVRSLAAKALLGAYRAEEDKSPIDPALAVAICGALSAATENLLSRQADEHAEAKAGLTEARQRHGEAANTADYLGSAIHATDRLRTQATSWKTALACVSNATDFAEQTDSKCIACLSEHAGLRASAATCLQDVVAAPKDNANDLSGELQQAELELTECESRAKTAERQLENLVQDKMVIARRLSECSEEVSRWLEAANKAEAQESPAGEGEIDLEVLLQSKQSSSGEVAGLTANECRQRHREAAVTLRILQAQVEQLDTQLQELSKEFLAEKENSASQRISVEELRSRSREAKQRHTGLLRSWEEALQAENSSDAELQQLGTSLRDAQNAIESERGTRGALREAVHALSASLVELDAHLASLEEEPHVCMTGTE